MNISAPFIARPVTTTLLTLGIIAAGALGFSKLPVSLMPQVDFPTIVVNAQLPGASPAVVASSVAEPLERHLGQIAAVTEMTSQSAVGATRITLQFDITRDINGASRDVQAAINAARADLPSNLPNNPTYYKYNPTHGPILVLALTSKTMTRGQIYDVASNILAPRFAQLSGIGNVFVGGSTLPAVRVELNPRALYKYGIGLEDVRAALASANANSPKGTIDDGRRRYQIYTNDQATKAADYAPLVIAYRNGAAVRLSDVAEVKDSVQDIRNLGMFNGHPSVLLILYRQPGANIIDTIDRVKAELPHLEAAMPADLKLSIAIDSSTAVRASLNDTELTLLIAVMLVTLVVYLFLRNIRATMIASIAVPISIFGTFGVMYLLGYSLDVLSLMALTIATGFVVDDAIVVLENISRNIDNGLPRWEATLRGTREVGFTVLSISLSLTAVFIPILLMGGILGRLFREFTVTLSIAILVSLVVSLTTTPMLCRYFLQRRQVRDRALRPDLFDNIQAAYARSLTWVLRRRGLVLLIFVATLCLNVALFIVVPKGLFPQQDNGRLFGFIAADQSVSFQAMSEKLRQVMTIVQQDPAVESVVGFAGAGSGWGGSSNMATVFVSLKPLSKRPSIDQVIGRLRPELAQVPSGHLLLVPAQDLHVGGRTSNAQYQYTLLSDSAETPYAWTPKLVDALEHNAVLADVSPDQLQKGLETFLNIDRDTAARLGITPQQIANTLYDAFGQRQVSVIYSARNQYHVVMEIDPRYAQYPDALRDVYIATSAATPAGTALSNAPAGTVTSAATGTRSPIRLTSLASPTSTLHPTGMNTHATATAKVANNNSARNTFTNALANTGKSATSAGAAVSTAEETMIPLAAISQFGPNYMPLSVHHQGLMVASTISFNLQPGSSLGQATDEINNAIARIHLPASIHGTFVGTTQLFQESLSKEPILIAAAIGVVYILLGILYESYIHPLTILSTLPSAGVGALLALIMFHTEFDIIGMIGLILLIGIVMKNAIMMIDVAVEARRSEHLNSYEAIFRGCMLRFRPILMTTAAAIFGAVPLAMSFGNGGEIRRPLGLAIVGGLIVSQLMTLYTTPVLYLFMEGFVDWSGRQGPQHWLGRRVYGSVFALATFTF
jgi:multidrug efflux pump